MVAPVLAPTDGTDGVLRTRGAGVVAKIIE